MITEDNFLLVAMHNYDNPQCVTVEEFEEDLKRFIWIKKLFYRYKEQGELCERMILNHLIVIYNVFGDIATQMLFFKMERELWQYLATFLVYLQRMPEYLKEYNLHVYEFDFDDVIIERLRKL